MNHQEHVSLNLNVRGLGTSATLAINELSHQLGREGKTIFKLGLGQSPFPVPVPVVEALRQNAHQKDYLPVQGLAQLREAVARFHQKNDGVHVDPDGVLIGPGSKELMFLLQLAYYGELVIPTPCWVSYVPQAQIIGRKVSYLPTSYEQQWHLKPEVLAEHCQQDPGRPRIVVLNYPGNPEGGTYDEEMLKQIAAIAREYDLILLSDEIYGKLTHDGNHISIARYYPEGTIISSGLSKWCGAGGWRLGTFAFPQDLWWLLEAMAAVGSETFTSTSAPIQYAAVRAFEGGYVIESYLAHARRVLAALGQWCAGCLQEVGAQVLSPRGAFYLFPDFSPLRDDLARAKIHTSVELCQRALQETGVAFLPGTAFGREAQELTARIAYVDFDGARALAASESISLAEPIDSDFLQVYCHQTTTGIERLCAWLRALCAA